MVVTIAKVMTVLVNTMKTASEALEITMLLVRVNNKGSLYMFIGMGILLGHLKFAIAELFE